MLSLIWAQDENGLIGREKQLPWHLPADMQWFKKKTLGKPLMMGRKTFESIGYPLPGRTNIVITSEDIKIDGCTIAHSLKEAITIAHGAGELMVMGGAQIYELALPQASRLYITKIHAAFEGDKYFPSFDTRRWRETFREDHGSDEKNMYSYSFHILERAAELQLLKQNPGSNTGSQTVTKRICAHQ